MKFNANALILMFTILATGCASKPEFVKTSDHHGEAYRIINEASKASAHKADRFVPREHGKSYLANARHSPICYGNKESVVSFLNTNAVCNRFRLNNAKSSFSSTMIIAGLAFPSGMSAANKSLFTAVELGDGIKVWKDEGELPQHLQDLSDEQKELLKLSPSLMRRKEKIPSIGLDKAGITASFMLRGYDLAPKVPTNYMLGWLPASYADTPIGVIKRLENEVTQSAEKLLSSKGYKLTEGSLVLSIIEKNDAVSRGVFGPGCGKHSKQLAKNADPSDFEAYSKVHAETPCNLQIRLGYGGDSIRHSEGVSDGYTFNDPSEIVERVKMPENGLPSRISHLSGKMVWRINPETAMEDMQLVLYMPPTSKQFDVESFYRSVSESLPGDLFFHVSYNEAFPVWTGEDLDMRGVPYLLDHGEELTYLILNQ